MSSSRCPGTSRSCTSASGKPRRSRGGRASGCPPRPSGSTRPEPASSSTQRRRLAVDVVTVRGLSRLRAVPVPRVFGGVLRRRVPDAPRRLVHDRSLVARLSFRNWDYPQRRQIFSGIRCARDAIAPPSRGSRSTSSSTTPTAAPSSTTRRSGASVRPRASYPRPGSTTSAGRSCSTRSRACPSTTRRTRSARSSRRERPRLPSSRRAARSSSSVPEHRRRRCCFSMRCRPRARSSGSCRST